MEIWTATLIFILFVGALGFWANHKEKEQLKNKG